MPRPSLEILDHVETPLGVLLLRRRALLSRPDTSVTEVTLDHELLMSSLHTASEEALATRALAWHGGTERRVLVGGLGLGYTARAALECASVREVTVVEFLPEVIRWLREGLVPLAEVLAAEPRLTVTEGDVYRLLLAPPERTWDVLLVDVDHSPTEPLGESGPGFHTEAGLRAVARHLAPGGVLAVWSSAENPEFAAALARVFPETRTETVRWQNELVDDGVEVEDHLYLARGS